MQRYKLKIKVILKFIYSLFKNISLIDNMIENALLILKI